MHFTKSEGSAMVKILRNMVLVLFLVVAVSIVYNFRNRESDTVSALISEATASVEFKGVFIRDETPVSAKGSGVLNYKISDGGKIGKGTIIAQVYSSEEQISINREIDKLNKELEVLKKIQNPGTQESVQPGSLSGSIEENYRDFILCRDRQDHSGIDIAKENLLVQMSTYQIITGEVKDFSEEIASINSQLDELRRRSSAPVDKVVSDTSAYFVSYCDGYEDKLSSKTLDKLTIAQINEITDNKDVSGSKVGKLIDGYCWYLAGVVDNSRKEYHIGANVKIKIASSADVFDATIYDVRDEGDASNSIIILSCDQFSHDLVQHRTEKVELIRGDFRGLKVPREAIRFIDYSDLPDSVKETGKENDEDKSYKGVYIRKGEQIEFKKIDVIYEGSDYVLSKIYEDDKSYLALYDDILLEGVDNGE